MAARFLQCVELTAENTLILRQSLSDEENTWIRENSLITIGAISIGHGYYKLQTIRSLQAHILTQGDQLITNFSYDAISRFEHIDAAVKACRREAKERKLQFIFNQLTHIFRQYLLDDDKITSLEELRIPSSPDLAVMVWCGLAEPDSYKLKGKMEAIEENPYSSLLQEKTTYENENNCWRLHFCHCDDESNK